VTEHIAAHPFDVATRVERVASRCQGRTTDAYWAFIGPFGGVTAATLLRAVLEDEARAGDPLALTVNFCAAISRGDFDLEVRRSRANRSTQHWSIVLSQAEGGIAATATAVMAVRREGFSHQPARRSRVRDARSLPNARHGGVDPAIRVPVRRRCAEHRPSASGCAGQLPVAVLDSRRTRPAA